MWRCSAACLGLDPMLFSEDGTDEQRAIGADVCSACPVRVACAVAGREEPSGVWGGVMHSNGRLLDPVSATTPKCGTNGGYQSHHERHEYPCDACRTAQGAAQERTNQVMAARREQAIDQVSVHRAVSGDPPEHMTYPERVEAVRVLAGDGFTDPQVAERMRMGRHAVTAIRYRNEIPPAERVKGVLAS